MKKCMNFLGIIILISYIFSSYNKDKNDYDLLLEWGKNNSVYISDKIEMNYTNQNNRNYYVVKKIKKDEIIISIPKSLPLNVASALNILGSKAEKKYKTYKKIFTDKNKEDKEILSYRIEQSFLAYLMTIANKNKSKKNKLYQNYKYFFNTFETNLENFPVYFSTDQFKSLMFSILGNEVVRIKRIFEEELELLEREIHKKTLDMDEYLKYRLFTFEKFINVSGTSYIIPFVDLLDTNPVNFNLQIQYFVENNTICIVATKDINPQDKLKMAVVQMTNSNSLIFYGKIYEENKNYIEDFLISKISRDYLKQLNLDTLIGDGDAIDITQKKYYEKVLPFYTKLSRLLKEDGSKASALRLFLENMKSIRNSYNKSTISELNKLFYNTKTAEHIKSVLDSEKHYLDKKIREMEKIFNKYNQERQSNLYS